MNDVNLNNPIFKSALLQVINRRFIVIGADMHPIKTDCGDQQCLQLTFVEAPDQHIFVPLDRLPEFDREIKRTERVETSTIGDDIP